LGEGIGLLPLLIVPHYRSDDAESAVMEDVVMYLDERRLPYKLMQDGDVLIYGD
jgi:hypothetical protein